MTGCYILAETYKNFANNDLADFWVVNFPPAYHQALLVSSGKTLEDQKDSTRIGRREGRKSPARQPEEKSSITTWNDTQMHSVIGCAIQTKWRFVPMKSRV
jgi:hypothetical protein